MKKEQKRKRVLFIIITTILIFINGSQPVKAAAVDTEETQTTDQSEAVQNENETSPVLSNTKIQFVKNGITLKIGETHALAWNLEPADALDAVTFTSDNEEAVTVDEDGIITGWKAGGAIITAALDNGEIAVISVKVDSDLESIRILYLTKNTATLGIGQNRTFYYKTEPLKASKTNMVWSSSNENIAVVDQNGKVTAKKAGKVKITLKADDGSGIKSIITVNVKTRSNKSSYTETGLSIVDTTKAKYTYTNMAEDLKLLQGKYGDRMSVTIVDTSYDKRNIYKVILGNPKAEKKILIQSSMHGREYMTTQLTMKLIELYCFNYYTGMYQKRFYSELFDEVAFHIIPMANPDGVTISQFGSKGIRNKTLRQKIEKVCKKYGKGKTSYYTNWKANARGVDLNRNFNVYWKQLNNGVKSPRAYFYKGTAAASEKETKALVKLVNEIKPVCTVSYHASGSILYWNFGQKGTLKKESRQLVDLAKSLTGYDLITSFKKSNSAGFSDWITVKKKLPAITIEIGSKSCPLKISEFKTVWKKNKMLFAELADLY